MPDYRLIDHTADVGVEWEARSLPGLFEKAAGILAHLLAGDEGASGEPASCTLSVEGLDLPDLLVHFLQELLFRFETKRELLGNVRVESVEAGGAGAEPHVLARASGRKFDPARDAAVNVIKAVTYHLLQAEPAPGGGWRARVLFDT